MLTIILSGVECDSPMFLWFCLLQDVLQQDTAAWKIALRAM